MTEKSDNRLPLEQTLLELAEAERAGVFRPTAADAQEVLARAIVAAPTSNAAASREPAVVRFLRVRWLPLGAAAMLVFGVWGVLFQRELVNVTQRAKVAALLTSGGGPAAREHDCDGSITGCFSGPTRLALSGCRTYDYDADGDVDLADIGTFQLACEGASRLR
ncbi:MAG: hypothetical protein HY763_16415 [Planctomycetes bacterium]|nr:hypothetical protein [Planctomycetota bacterium]